MHVLVCAFTPLGLRGSFLELNSTDVVRSSFRNCVYRYLDIRHNTRSIWTVCQKQRRIFVTCESDFGLQPIFLCNMDSNKMSSAAA